MDSNRSKEAVAMMVADNFMTRGNPDIAEFSMNVKNVSDAIEREVAKIEKGGVSTSDMAEAIFEQYMKDKSNRNESIPNDFYNLSTDEKLKYIEDNDKDLFDAYQESSGMVGG